MELKSHKYELPADGSTWTKSVELGAGIFFLDGRTHVVGRSSAAERQLLDRGALLIATLRFDPDPLEKSHTGRPVRTLGLWDALQRFGGAASTS